MGLRQLSGGAQYKYGSVINSGKFIIIYEGDSIQPSGGAAIYCPPPHLSATGFWPKIALKEPGQKYLKGKRYFGQKK